MVFVYNSAVIIFTNVSKLFLKMKKESNRFKLIRVSRYLENGQTGPSGSAQPFGTLPWMPA